MVQKNCLTSYNSIIILGPTASGKTNVSIGLAQAINGEIISADSMQFYKHISIGTAKATKEEQSKAKHHLIDFLELEASYNVAQYRMQVEEVCKDIWDRKKLPIIVGGSGFYVKTLLDKEFNIINKNLQEKKERLEKELIEKYADEQWYEMLKEKDSILAEKVHPNNKKRVLNYLIKTILIHDQHGKEDDFHESEVFLKPLIIVLNPERDVLYERINRRVDMMLELGILDEAKMLLEKNLNPNAQCLAAIGYKEFFPYLKGQDTLENCIDVLKQKSRNYAKRQITWMKHQVDNAIWIDPFSTEDVVRDILELFHNVKNDKKN